jgi:hypothetical protein
MQEQLEQASHSTLKDEDVAGEQRQSKNKAGNEHMQAIIERSKVKSKAHKTRSNRLRQSNSEWRGEFAVGLPALVPSVSNPSETEPQASLYNDTVSLPFLHAALAAASPHAQITTCL